MKKDQPVLIATLALLLSAICQPLPAASPAQAKVRSMLGEVIEKYGAAP